MSIRTWEGVPAEFQRTYDKSRDGKSKTLCIKAMCQECYRHEPRCKADIRECNDSGCPLYPVRPYRVREKSMQAKTPESLAPGGGS